MRGDSGYKLQINIICAETVWDFETPYTYYSYQVMSPLGAVLDVTKRVVDQGGQLFDQIIKIAKIIGIIVGVLLVLLIIYNIVKSRSK